MGSHPRNIFPFFPVRGSRSPPSNTEYGYSTPACCVHENDVKCSKRVKVNSTRKSNQVLKLTDDHISRHVVSTFKCLTTCTTHCGLSIFSLNRRGLNHKYHPMTPPVILMIAVRDKLVRTYNLASSRKLLDFYRS